MKIPVSFEDLAEIVKAPGKTVLLFTADWCGDCRFLEPYLPALEEENPDFRFVKVDRDEYLTLAKEWDIFGIPSLVVLENGQEIGRLVNKKRKSKEEISAFLTSLLADEVEN